MAPIDPDPPLTDTLTPLDGESRLEEAADAPCAWLTQPGGEAPYPLTRPLTLIGRYDTDARQRPDLPIYADDAVSRRHLEIHQVEDGFNVLDCGSTNGTYLNGETLSPDEPRRLQEGDEISLGNRTTLTFTLAPPTGAEVTPPPEQEMEIETSWPAPEPEHTMSPPEGTLTTVPPVAEFPTSLRGYDRDAVDSYMTDLRQRLMAAEETIERLNDDLAAERSRIGGSPAEMAVQPIADQLAELEEARRRIREFEENERFVQRALIVAQKAADEVRVQAEQEAAEVLQGARAEADGIEAELGGKRAAAEAEAEQVRTQALEEAEVVLADARARVEEVARQAEQKAAARLEALRDQAAQAETGLQELRTRRQRFGADWSRYLDDMAGLLERERELTSRALANGGEPGAPAAGPAGVG